jgi:hypothetical protein
MLKKDFASVGKYTEQFGQFVTLLAVCMITGEYKTYEKRENVYMMTMRNKTIINSGKNRDHMNTLRVI